MVDLIIIQRHYFSIGGMTVDYCVYLLWLVNNLVSTTDPYQPFSAIRESKRPLGRESSAQCLLQGAQVVIEALSSLKESELLTLCFVSSRNI
jgi:hypothetical protein